MDEEAVVLVEEEAAVPGLGLGKIARSLLGFEEVFVVALDEGDDLLEGLDECDPGEGPFAPYADGGDGV